MESEEDRRDAERESCDVVDGSAWEHTADFWEVLTF